MAMQCLLSSRTACSMFPKVVSHQVVMVSSFSTETFPNWKPKRKGRNSKRNYERMHMRKRLIQKFELQNIEHEKKAEELNLGWSTSASLIVERPPAIHKDVPQWEQDFTDLQEKFEYYDQHDWPEGVGLEHPDKIDYEHEDMTLPFELASRETPADGTGDMTTMERALQESLYLMFQTPNSSWEFPHVTLKEDEFLGLAAIRAISESASNMPRLFHFKRQPIGYMYQPHDEEMRNELKQYGTRQYIYSAVVIDPYESIFEGENIQTKNSYSSISWRKKSEVCEVVQPEFGEYLQHILD